MKRNLQSNIFKTANTPYLTFLQRLVHLSFNLKGEIPFPSLRYPSPFTAHQTRFHSPLSISWLPTSPPAPLLVCRLATAATFICCATIGDSCLLTHKLLASWFSVNLVNIWGVKWFQWSEWVICGVYFKVNQIYWHYNKFIIVCEVLVIMQNLLINFCFYELECGQFLD